ncbi:MAG TPA: branched-chain amino acid aminotransferase [Gemmatimonadaceae bacterium]|nr:branched-chain amino acid aminotransferase [Gemmatimonadaceae bacterium]
MAASHAVDVGVDITIDRIPTSRLPGVDLASVAFGTVYSDHMFSMEFSDGEWRSPCIRPYGPLPLVPNISALQYGISVFEGLKAHRSANGDVLLFRPTENARRLNRSAARLAMPEVPADTFLHGLRSLVALDRDWIPPAGQGALYIRPSYFSTDESIRVRPAERYRLVIFTCPFSAYYSAPLDVLVTEKYVRAFPGGTGNVKPAGNYGPTLLADMEARDAGCSTVMWLDALTRGLVEECGVTNLFFVLDGRIVTPRLSGTILAGITRDSVCTLLRDTGMEVVERDISIQEVLDGIRSGAMSECFVTGTAATLSHVRKIRYRNEDFVLKPVDERVVGPAVREVLVGVMTGAISDPHSWVEIV